MSTTKRSRPINQPAILSRRLTPEEEAIGDADDDDDIDDTLPSDLWF